MLYCYAKIDVCAILYTHDQIIKTSGSERSIFYNMV